MLDSKKTPIKVEVNGEVVDVRNKVVIVRVPDLNEARDAEYAAKMLQKAGAVLVFFADKTASLEALGDEELKGLGLQRLVAP